MKARDLKYNEEVKVNGRNIIRLEMVHDEQPYHVVYELNFMELVNVDPNTDLNDLYPPKEEVRTKGSSKKDSYRDRMSFFMNNMNFQTK